jgi:hypothetical protein
VDASGGGPPHRGPGRDGAERPGRSNHAGQRVPDKTDRTSVGLFATGATSGASGSLGRNASSRVVMPAR